MLREASLSKEVSELEAALKGEAASSEQRVGSVYVSSPLESFTVCTSEITATAATSQGCSGER